MTISILSISAKKRKIAQEVIICFHIWVWGDRRQNAGSLGFDPTGWTRAISFFLHVYFHPLHEVWPKVMIIIITRLLAVDPLKLVIDTRLTQSIYAFFSQICQLKHISSPAEQNQKIHTSTMEAEIDIVMAESKTNI